MEQDPLSITESDLFISEAYDQQLAKVPVALNLKGFVDEPDMFIYPNPFNSRVIIDLISPSENNGTMTIASLDGRIVYRKDLAVQKGINRYELSADELPATGIYIMNLRTPEIALSDKLIYVE